jgi:hypothetical protein
MADEEGADLAPADDVAAPSEAVADTDTPDKTIDAEAFEASLDEDLRSIFAKNNPNRAPDGKFASKSDQSPTEKTPEQSDPTAIPVPQSWSADVKAKWDVLPSDVKAFVAKREQEAHEHISRQGQQLKAYEPFQRVLEQSKPTFEKYGMSVEEGISQVLRANDYLERDARSAIRDLATAYGVDLRALAGLQGAPQNATEHALRAEIADLRTWQQSVMQRMSSQERQEFERTQGAIQTQIAEFAKDKTDFADLEDEIEHEIIVLKQKSPDLPITEVLAKAYDRARWANPEARAKVLEAEKKAEEAKRLEEAKKRSSDAKRVAPLNVKSSTANSSAPKSWDDDLKEAYRRSASR